MRSEGGWHDWFGSFDSIENVKRELEEFARDKGTPPEHWCYQIVDRDTEKIVSNCC